MMHFLKIKSSFEHIAMTINNDINRVVLVAVIIMVVVVVVIIVVL